MDNCSKCGMPLENEGTSCPCNTGLCIHCCACDSGCGCGCDDKDCKDCDK